MQKRNILLLVERSEQGGAEKVAEIIAVLLAEMNHSVHYCAMYQIDKWPNIPNVRVSSLGLKSGKGLWRKSARYLTAMYRLRQFKKKNDIDLTISSLWPADWLNRLTCKRLKIAIIQINILNNEQNQAMVKARKFVSWVYKGFDKVVLGGSNLEPELTGFFGLPKTLIQVIHNPINMVAARRMAVETPVPALDLLLSQGNVLVAANRLAPIKNTTALIRIIPLIRSAGTRLLIIGEGAEKEMLLQQSKDAGIPYQDLSDGELPDLDRVIFFVPFQKNLFAILSRASLFLLPSLGEGLPLVLLDAMSVGCPAIVSDCPNGGISEIMQHPEPFQITNPRKIVEKATGGYLMPIPLDPASDQQWAETITQVLQENDQILKDDASIAVKRAAQFDIGFIKTKWEQLCAELFKQRDYNENR